MAALSIAIVQAAAHKNISKNLVLRRVNSKNCFEWVYLNNDERHIQEVPTDKIRGLKLDEWLRYARGLVDQKPIEGAPPPILNAEPERPAGPAGGPQPSFMLLKNRERPIPFDRDPEVQGYKDAVRGFTACPYGLDHERRRWNKGHDRAVAEGVAKRPRFGLVAGKRN